MGLIIFTELKKLLRDACLSSCGQTHLMIALLVTTNEYISFFFRFSIIYRWVLHMPVCHSCFRICCLHNFAMQPFKHRERLLYSILLQHSLHCWKNPYSSQWMAQRKTSLYILHGIHAASHGGVHKLYYKLLLWFISWRITQAEDHPGILLQDKSVFRYHRDIPSTFGWSWLGV